MGKKFSKDLSFVLVGIVSILIFYYPVFAREKYPEKPVQLIVTWAPGGAADLGSRVIAEKMTEFLGQPIVSIFKPGGGGTLGTAYAAGLKPDGYNLVLGSDTGLVIQPVIKKGLTYDLESFTYVGGFMEAPSLFAIKGDAPWKTLSDFVADAKKNPKKFKFGVPGVLTTTHVAWEVFSQKAGIETVCIPFLSTGELWPALLGGHIDVAVATAAGGLSKAGSIRILAVAEKERLSYLPNVPTLYEFGYPVELYAIYSFGAPKGTPKEIIEILYKAQEKALKKYGNEIKEQLARVEMSPYINSGEEYYKIMKERQKLYFEIGKALNLIPK